MQHSRVRLQVKLPAGREPHPHPHPHPFPHRQRGLTNDKWQLKETPRWQAFTSIRQENVPEIFGDLRIIIYVNRVSCAVFQAKI